MFSKVIRLLKTTMSAILKIIDARKIKLNSNNWYTYFGFEFYKDNNGSVTVNYENYKSYYFSNINSYKLCVSCFFLESKIILKFY